MTELAVLLPLVAFLVLAVGFAVVLRRAGHIVARTREVENFRTSVRELAARIDQSLEGAVGRIDAVRRQQLAADTMHATIEAATDAIARYTDEARALHGPPAADSIRDDLVAELERADRALAMVDHGATIMAAVAPARSRARGPDLDQARVPQPRPRPRGDPPPRRPRRGARRQPRPRARRRPSRPRRCVNIAPDHTM